MSLGASLRRRLEGLRADGGRARSGPSENERRRDRHRAGPAASQPQALTEVVAAAVAEVPPLPWLCAA